MTLWTACSSLIFVLLAASSSAQDLEQSFANPPASARPHTWWHWMNGNITREGITADLEAMHEIGLGGAQIFNVSESIPDGPILFMSTEWRALLKHAVTEANRLGLELCIHNCAGWSSSGGPWITPELAMQMVVFSETAATGPARFSASLPQPETRLEFYRDIAVLAFPTPSDDEKRIPEIKAKAGYEPRYGLQPELAEFPPESIVKRERIVDLTTKLAADGRLSWDVPAGSWTILRIGHTPTGKTNHPSPESGRGLECDKLSRAALDAHWAGMMGKIIQDLGALAGTTLNNCLIDSYEVGHQNWTPLLREEFVKRRRYDLLPMLPALTGRVIDSGEATERFLWDLRRTIADLFADHYFGRFSELCHQNGMLCSIEPYDGPFECLLAGRGADIPMGEFWVGGGESSSCKLAASVAHTYGQKLVGAESFTAEPSTGRWQNHPYSLKAVGDLMYCAGVNRFIVHRYAHQPWLDLRPGMTMGQWGTHFERTVTWWTQGAAWVRYLTRCQSLLQQGLFVADVCYFAGEDAPSSAPYNPALKAAGFDYDACNADVLLERMTVRNGLLVLQDGMSYRLLVLPDSAFMTPRVIAKVRDLVRQGATIIGRRPARSPSLADVPAGDEQVRQLAAALWGGEGSATQARAGDEPEKGRVIEGRSPEEVLASMGVKPDCEFSSAYGKPRMAWIHRRVAAADLYFLSNQRPYAQDVRCTFRIGGRSPELWHPDTGAIETAPVWFEEGGRITVPIHFDPAGSMFVVFRRAAGSADHVLSMTGPEVAAPLAEIEIVRASYEATDGTGGADVTAKVAELVRDGEVSIAAQNSIFGDPAVNHVKRLQVEYKVRGKAVSRSVDENQTLELIDAGESAPPVARLVRSTAGALELHAFRPGPYQARFARGRVARVEVEPLPAPFEIAGPWSLLFGASPAAPASITLDRLISWSEHPEAPVRYFSGTAEYQCDFELPAQVLKAGRIVQIDLGRVKNIAEVSLNGKDLGVWWKPPFAGDVSSCVKPGTNTIKVRVTNLWANRLIGDEQFDEDCDWNGVVLKRWPQWLLDQEPRPVRERQTFTTWRHYTRESTLLESGLLGPVLLYLGERVAID